MFKFWITRLKPVDKSFFWFRIGLSRRVTESCLKINPEFWMKILEKYLSSWNVKRLSRSMFFSGRLKANFLCWWNFQVARVQYWLVYVLHSDVERKGLSAPPLWRILSKLDAGLYTYAVVYLKTSDLRVGKNAKAHINVSNRKEELKELVEHFNVSFWLSFKTFYLLFLVLYLP